MSIGLITSLASGLKAEQNELIPVFLQSLTQIHIPAHICLFFFSSVFTPIKPDEQYLLLSSQQYQVQALTAPTMQGNKRPWCSSAWDSTTAISAIS